MDHLLQIGFTITGFTAIVLLIKNEDNRPTKYAVLLLSLKILTKNLTKLNSKQILGKAKSDFTFPDNL